MATDVAVTYTVSAGVPRLQGLQRLPIRGAQARHRYGRITGDALSRMRSRMAARIGNALDRVSEIEGLIPAGGIFPSGFFY